MIVFPYGLCDFGILETQEGELSGLSVWVTGDLEVGDLFREVLKVFFNLFLGEVFWDILNDDSTHWCFIIDNTFYMIIIKYMLSTTMALL